MADSVVVALLLIETQRRRPGQGSTESAINKSPADCRPRMSLLLAAKYTEAMNRY